jgi:hypothetical protein
MIELLTISAAIALAFTLVICGIVYAFVSDLGGLKPAQRRVMRRRMRKYGFLALMAAAFIALLVLHGYGFILATVIVGGVGLLIVIFMFAPREISTDGESNSYRNSGSYEPNFERYAASLPGLKQQLIRMLQGDRRAAHDMVLYEKSVLPSGYPEAWYWKAAIQRLERDRR